MLKPSLNKSGFTLIELVVVIAILGILALIAIPRLGGFSESARQSNDREFAAEVANAAAIYLAGHREVVGVDDVAAVDVLSESELVLALSNSGVLDGSYNTLESLDDGLISIEYSTALSPTFDIKYDGTTVTVILTGNTANLVYTIIK